jgi:hypothetical protein
MNRIASKSLLNLSALIRLQKHISSHHTKISSPCLLQIVVNSNWFHIALPNQTKQIASQQQIISFNPQSNKIYANFS